MALQSILQRPGLQGRDIVQTFQLSKFKNVISERVKINATKKLTYFLIGV